MDFEGIFVLLMSIFAAKVAIAYVVVGLVIAVAGGTIIEKLQMEKQVETFIMAADRMEMESLDLTRRER